MQRNSIFQSSLNQQQQHHQHQQQSNLQDDFNSNFKVISYTNNE
jgi:hypothetical protein